MEQGLSNVVRTSSNEDIVKMYVSLNRAVHTVLDVDARNKVLEKAVVIYDRMGNPLEGTIWENA